MGRSIVNFSGDTIVVGCGWKFPEKEHSEHIIFKSFKRHDDSSEYLIDVTEDTAPDMVVKDFSDIDPHQLGIAGKFNKVIFEYKPTGKIKFCVIL